MPEEPLRILLDQNVPKPVAVWLRNRCPDWEIHHVNELGQFYPLGEHHGIIRLRVWPTTIEKTKEAMERLLHDLPHSKWKKSLMIIDNKKIRIRKLKKTDRLSNN